MSLLTAVIILLWIVPLAIRAKVSKGTILRMAAGFCMGAVPVVIGAVVLNTKAEEAWLPAMGLTGASLAMGRALAAGLIEESLKLLAALLCAIRMRNARRIDYILVFGAVGAGFEILESVAAASDLLTLAVRVLLALHVVWLYHEGWKFFDTKNGKPLSLLFGYLTVVILHALFDLAPMVMVAEGLSEDAQIIAFLGLIVSTLINIVFIIRTMLRINKDVKASV